MKIEDYDNIKADVLQILLHNFNLKETLNDDFFKNLNEEFTDLKIVSLSLAFGEDKKQRVLNLGHLTRENEETNKVIVDSSDSEHLEKFIKVFKRYKGIE